MDDIVDGIKSSVIRWWAAVSSDKRPKPNPARMVTVDELPMYPDETHYYEEVRETSLPIEEEISLLRQAAMHRFGNCEVSFNMLVAKSQNLRFLNICFGEKVERSCHSSSSRRLQEEYGMLPKAAAITVGGLAGFLFGMKKSVFRRFLYSGVGLLTMTAFCYPYETIAITRTAVEHSKMTWDSFVRSKFFLVFFAVSNSKL
ncbi:unnamed protein product [Thelazia callipaeda]|uniref:MICOS complex subunit n=1 Tax=Thelazia callipaeda TaxID=103827 RepID=A0A0N5CZJ8_THECL|nr:unnamed protein product [Thelazia callipaeda]